MTKFNIGDRVRLSVEGAVSDGTEGIVTGENEYGHTTFTVTKACGPYALVGDVRNEWPHALVLVAAPFKVGDLVRYDSKGTYAWDGIEGIVTSIEGAETYIRVLKGYKPSNVQVGRVEAFSTKYFTKIEDAKHENNAVEHPNHYGGDTPYEVIKVAEAWGFDKDAYLFNVLKYIARAGKKGDVLEQHKKARFYLDRKIKQLEEA